MSDQPQTGHDVDAVRSEARHLAEIWDRLARTHMMAGGGCACGVGGVVVALEDFEQDIADYIVAETERLERQDVRDVLDAHGLVGELWSIPQLLSALADAQGTIDPQATAFVVERLGRTLRSFEKLHGGG